METAEPPLMASVTAPVLSAAGVSQKPSPRPTRHVSAGARLAVMAFAVPPIE